MIAHAANCRVNWGPAGSGCNCQPAESLTDEERAAAASHANELGALGAASFTGLRYEDHHRETIDRMAGQLIEKGATREDAYATARHGARRFHGHGGRYADHRS